MTIRARLQTSLRLLALLVAAAIVIATPYGIASAIRSGVCVATTKAMGRAAGIGGYVVLRLDA